MQKLLKQHGDGSLKMISIASSPILGTPNSMTSFNADIRQSIEQAYAVGLSVQNERTLGAFIPEFTASPHPRFLGLA